MKVRMVWVQGDDATWLEAAWDEETVAANYSGWCDEVDKARKMAHENNYELRIQIVDVPQVYELFEVSEVKARVLPTQADEPMVERVMEVIAAEFGACSNVTAVKVLAAALREDEERNDGR